MAAKAKGVTGQAKFPAKLRCLFKPLRYKISHGGRGSSKSWSIARALLILGAKKPLRILCAREVQKSLKDSVYKLLVDQIKALGLSGKYDVLESTIRGKKNGTEILFSGLSSVTAENIKSFESVDICWVEEGQTITKRSWDILTPTIRKEGSEIWISMNPELETDESYRRFVANPPPDSVVVEMNWRDNPWFTKELEAERRHALRTMSTDDYENIWEGKCRKAAVGAIYAADITAAIKSGRVRPVPYDPLLKVHTIWDLGWNDSMTIIMAQRAASEIRVIDYIEGSHRTLASYVNGDPNDPDLDYLGRRPWNWGKDFLPHDGFHKDYKTGKTSKQILEALGRKVHEEPVANIGLEEGIKATRATFHQIYFDDGENVARLIECLRRYRRAINERTGEPGSPVHDEFSHGSDAARYLCIAAELMTNDRHGGEHQILHDPRFSAGRVPATSSGY